MEIFVIVLILTGAIVIYFATKFLGKMIGMTIKLLLLAIVALALLTILVYKDMNDLRKGFAEDNNTFLLYENNKLYSAITLKPLTNATLSLDSFEYFTVDEINQSQQALNSKNYSALLSEQDSYRMFIIKPILLNKPYSLNLKANLTEGDLLNVLMSDEPFMALAEKVQDNYDLSPELIEIGLIEMYGDEGKLKGFLFAALLSNYFQQQKPGELVKNIKDKKIIVYPESISFKIIKYMPWV